MKNNSLRGLVACGLLFSITLLHSCVSKEQPNPQATNPITVIDLLAAHGIIANPHVTSVFTAHAQRTVSFTGEARNNPSRNDGYSSNSSGTFTRLVTIARNGQLFRYERADPVAPTIQIDLFDGHAVHHAMAANGNLLEEYQRPGHSPSESVGIELKSLGLLPVLARLSQPETDSSYEALTAQGMHKLLVKVSNRVWMVYADSAHLIRRLEFQDNAFEYDDYRELGHGVWLPFTQRFYARGKLHYELSFTKIDLKPEFPLNYFTLEGINVRVRVSRKDAKNR